MAKHTPGPWVVDTKPRHLSPVVRTVDENGPADFIARNITSPDDAAMANAALIAAAPDLLKALIGVREAVRDHLLIISSPAFAEAGRTFMSMVNDAIAKAEPKPVKSKSSVAEIYCDACDGVGWVEGGEALKSTCHKCGGRGVVPE